MRVKRLAIYKASGKENARIEHDKVLLQVMMTLMEDDTELLK